MYRLTSSLAAVTEDHLHNDVRLLEDVEREKKTLTFLFITQPPSPKIQLDECLHTIGAQPSLWSPFVVVVVSFVAHGVKHLAEHIGVVEVRYSHDLVDFWHFDNVVSQATLEEI